MKVIKLIILAVFVFSNAGFTQDLIITKAGDSLECKITKVTTKFIHIDYIVKDQRRSTIVDINQVKSYKLNAKSTSSNENSVGVQNQKGTLRESVDTESTKSTALNGQRIKLNFAGGYSHLTAPGAEGLPQELKDYEKELRSGNHFTASIAYFLESDVQSTIGFGLKINYMRTKHSTQVLFQDPIDPTITFMGTLSDDIKCFFIGPQMFSKYYLDRTNTSSFYMALSLGYASYQDNVVVFYPVSVTSETFGADINLGFDVYIAPSIFLNFQSSYLVNTYSNLIINGQTVKVTGDDMINNNHLNFSLGLSFYLD